MMHKNIFTTKISDLLRYAPFSIDKLFLAIMILNLIGAVRFYQLYASTIYIPIIVGILGYLLGTTLGKFRLGGGGGSSDESRKHITRNTRAEYEAIMVLFAICLVVGFSVFAKGIPLLNSYDNALRSSIGDNTQGRIRFLMCGLPMASIACFSHVLSTGQHKKSFMLTVFATLLGFSLYTYKAYILWYVIALFYVYYYYRFSNSRPLNIGRWIILALCAYALMALIFSLWLNGSSAGTTSLLDRMLYDQLAGFDYIYRTYVPLHGFSNGSFLSSELLNLAGLNTGGYSFLETLATMFYGRQVTWGIVPTYYGYFYFDYGLVSVFLSLLLFGFIVAKLNISLSKFNDKSNFDIVFMVMMIFMLGFIFQNGSVFNEIRGTFVSVFVFWVILRALYAICSANKSKKSNKVLSENR
jgi:oligosaccharide repeat unit polymerase